MNKSLLFILLGSVLFFSCEELFKSGADDSLQKVATVVGFNYMPNDTVSVGDTLTIEAIIADSLDIKKQYSWTFQDTVVKNNRRYISFIVSGGTGEKLGGLVINPDTIQDQNYKSDSSIFSYNVQ